MGMVGSRGCGSIFMESEHEREDILNGRSGSSA